MDHLQHFFVALVDHYGYGGLLIALILGNVGLPVGAELVLPISGALTSTGHLASIWLTIAVALAGELVGQSVAYAIGRFGGVPVLVRYGKYVGFHHAQMDRVHGFFARYGTFSIFICRFVPVVRGIVGFPAGIAEMPFGPFFLWTLFGSLVFCGIFAFVGYQLGDHLGAVLPLLHKGGTIAGIAGLVAVAIVVLVWLRRRRRNPSAAEDDS